MKNKNILKIIYCKIEEIKICTLITLYNFLKHEIRIYKNELKTILENLCISEKLKSDFIYDERIFYQLEDKKYNQLINYIKREALNAFDKENPIWISAGLLTLVSSKQNLPDKRVINAVLKLLLINGELRIIPALTKKNRFTRAITHASLMKLYKELVAGVIEILNAKDFTIEEEVSNKLNISRSSAYWLLRNLFFLGWINQILIKSDYYRFLYCLPVNTKKVEWMAAKRGDVIRSSPGLWFELKPEEREFLRKRGRALLDN